MVLNEIQLNPVNTDTEGTMETVPIMRLSVLSKGPYVDKQDGCFKPF